LRFGWPKPVREPNGYRKYSEQLVDDLKWLKSELDRGRTIGQLIADGDIIRPPPLPPNTRQRNAEIDFSSIPLPTTDIGLRIRQQLEEAIRTNNVGLRALIESEGARLRPSERELAVTSVLRLAYTVL
jgi:DNA-binding transcriptional MerR regulator